MPIDVILAQPKIRVLRLLRHADPMFTSEMGDILHDLRRDTLSQAVCQLSKKGMLRREDADTGAAHGTPHNAGSRWVYSITAAGRQHLVTKLSVDMEVAA